MRANCLCPSSLSQCRYAWLLAIVLFLHHTPALGQTYIDYPGNNDTYPAGINNSGTIVGFYVDSLGVGHGFTYANGVYATIDFPGASGTFPYGINDSNVIVGSYTVPQSTTYGTIQVWHGFSYANGIFQSIDFPGASNTFISGINNNGTVVGSKTPLSDSEGFTFTPGSGNFTVIMYPGGFNVDGVNDSDFFVGYILVPNLTYYIGATGTIDSISPYAVPGYITLPLGVNDSGVIVGFLSQVLRSGSPAAPDVGFVDVDNQVFTFTSPGSQETDLTGINNLGQIVGCALYSRFRGFLTSVDQVLKAGTRHGANFYTVPPCRAVDTRLAPGTLGGPALRPGEKRVVGLAGVCGLPSTPAAVAVNITVVGPETAGFLTLGPSDQALPATSAINFGAGAVRANSAVMKVAVEGTAGLLVYNGSSGTMHFILDVSGYFQ